MCVCLYLANTYRVTVLSTLKLLTYLIVYMAILCGCQADCTQGCFSNGGHRTIPSEPLVRGSRPSQWHSLGRGRSSDRKLTLEVSLRMEKWFFFLVRKIGLKLTSVTIFLYFVCGTPPLRGLMRGVYVRAQDLNLWTPGHLSRVCELNHYATGLDPRKVIFDSL